MFKIVIAFFVFIWGQALMIAQMFGLTNYETALVAWILGTLYSLLLPFYFKVRSGEMKWSDFNPGFLINTVISIAIGIIIGLEWFAVWTIPDGSQWQIFVTAFFMAAGFDQEFIVRILKRIGIYESIFNRINNR